MKKQQFQIMDILAAAWVQAESEIRIREQPHDFEIRFFRLLENTMMKYDILPKCDDKDCRSDHSETINEKYLFLNE